MRRSWQLKEAKDKLGDIVEDVLRYGPQVITRDETAAVVVLSYAEYQRLMLSQKSAELFGDAPPVELERAAGDHSAVQSNV